ncbi:unnamed protein product [Urochloa humidicola]
MAGSVLGIQAASRAPASGVRTTDGAPTTGMQVVGGALALGAVEERRPAGGGRGGAPAGPRRAAGLCSLERLVPRGAAPAGPRCRRGRPKWGLSWSKWARARR